ncbi:MAG: M20/M25/M40 family metallo-hydrolase [Gemmatimonadales bacterium]
MASTSQAELDLLHTLVGTSSVSGTEEALGRWVETELRTWGLDVSRDETGVLVEVRGKRAGPTLAFASHLDTVPPGEGWTRDPFTPVVLDGKLYGRGSGDAKASVSAMLTAARDVAEQGGPATGRLVVLLGYGEETRHTSMPALVERAGQVDAAVVGEPTNLDVAVAQRGLMMVDLVARGDQRHAGYAADGKFTNAVTVLAADILALGSVAQDRPHLLLGQPTITATMLEAGVSRNVTPPTAKAVLDVRSTPAWSHADLAAELKRRLTSEVIVTSDRLVPCETRRDSALLGAVLRARPTARTFGSPTCSDWVFLRGSDTVKCGPGTSRRSHTADECVELDEVTAARAFYARAAKEYLG